MINIKEFNGRVIKKRIKCHSAAFRWHNKNKRGGNFGINIYFKEYIHHTNRMTDKEFTGYYNKKGEIYILRFSPLYKPGVTLPIWTLESLDILFDYIKKYINWEKGKGEFLVIKDSETLTRKEQFKLIGFEEE